MLYTDFSIEMENPYRKIDISYGHHKYEYDADRHKKSMDMIPYFVFSKNYSNEDKDEDHPNSRNRIKAILDKNLAIMFLE